LETVDPGDVWSDDSAGAPRDPQDKELRF
jgi:hypothetical protein